MTFGSNTSAPSPVCDCCQAFCTGFSHDKDLHLGFDTGATILMPSYDNDFIAWESTNENILSQCGLVQISGVYVIIVVLFISFQHVNKMYQMLLLDCFHLQPTSDSMTIVRRADGFHLMSCGEFVSPWTK